MSHGVRAGLLNVLIPYQQGGLFRQKLYVLITPLQCLNPLSAGRSFQTSSDAAYARLVSVLIPYQQGGLFRRFQRIKMVKLK